MREEIKWIFHIDMTENSGEKNLQALLDKARKADFEVLCVSPTLNNKKVWIEFLHTRGDANLNKKIQSLVSMPEVEGGKWVKLENSYSYQKKQKNKTPLSFYLDDGGY